MQGQIPPEFIELERKIDNWRRHYRVGMRIESVPYYTPPRYGNIVNDDIIATLPAEQKQAVLASIQKQREQIYKLPPDMQEAVRLELVWRNLEDQGKKWFIKWVHIDQIHKSNNGCFILWRRLKQFGVRIRSYEQQESFNIRALTYFNERYNA
jgi:hypothetical protein